METEELQPLLKSVLDDGWLEYTVNHEWTLKNPLFGRIALESIEEERLSLYTVQLAQVLGRKAASKPLIVALINLERRDEALLEACRLATHHLSMLCPQSAMDVLEEVVQMVPFEDTVTHGQQIEVGLLFCRALSQISATDPRLTHVLGWLETHAKTDKTRRSIHSIRAHLQRWLGHYPNYRKMLVDAWKMQEAVETPELLSDLARQLGDSHLWLAKWMPRVDGLTAAVNWRKPQGRICFGHRVKWGVQESCTQWVICMNLNSLRHEP